MSNCHTELCFEFPLPEEAAKIAIELNDLIESYSRAIFHTTPTVENNPLFKEIMTKNPDVGVYTGCSCEYIDGKLRVETKDDNANVEMLSYIMQVVLKEFNINTVCGIEWSQHCSRHIPGGFGGGLAIVTKDNIQNFTTHEMFMKATTVQEEPKCS